MSFVREHECISSCARDLVAGTACRRGEINMSKVGAPTSIDEAGKLALDMLRMK